MFPSRLISLPQTMDAVVDTINGGHLNVTSLSSLTAVPHAALLEDGRGEPYGLKISVGLQRGSTLLSTAQIHVRIQDPKDYVLPAVIDWDNDGKPVVIEPVQDILDSFAYHWSTMENWCSDWYINNFGPADVAARIGDQMTRRMSDYIRDVALRCTSSQAAPSLVRIVPLPERFITGKAGMMAPQIQLACLIEGATRIKNRWPDAIDISAGSQDRPLQVASLAIDGSSPLISGSPFNENYMPAKRRFMVRSLNAHRANKPSKLRVTVANRNQPFADSIVTLVTAFGRTDFNSLDAQAMTRSAMDKMASLVTQRIRLINPIHVMAKVGGTYSNGTPLAFDHDGLPRELHLPDRCVPPGTDLPRFSVAGKAVITDIYENAEYGDGEIGVQVTIEYQYLYPSQSGDKVATPSSIKGAAVEVDFEARAFIDGQWVNVEVLSSDQNIYKRGAAIIQHGALEMACHLDNTEMEVPVDVKWEEIAEFAKERTLDRIVSNDKLVTGRVPVQYRRRDDEGNWTQWYSLGMTWVGLVPWLRTTNTAYAATRIGKHAVPDQLITQVSCLRGWAMTHPNSLINHYVQEKPVIAEQLCDVLSRPVLTEKQIERMKANPEQVTMVHEDLSVTYRGKTYHPTLVTRAFETVGTLSMQVLHNSEHKKPFEEVAGAGHYPNSVLDSRSDGGFLLDVSKTSWTPPASIGKFKLAQCRYIFLPPQFCHKLLQVNTKEPVSGHPIINRAALYLNSLMELQAPGSDPKGTRRASVTNLAVNVLSSELTERGGSFYSSYHPNQSGIQYVNLSLDCCPAGEIWLSERMFERYHEEVGPLREGRRGITMRFPITPGRGMQGVVLKKMPRWLKADVVTNSTTSELEQDGDNDGDLCAVHFPPIEYRKEVDSMRATYPMVRPEMTDSIPMNLFESSGDAQIYEATLMAELKSKIGPASSAIYRWLAAQKWTPENQTEIHQILRTMGALMKSAVKKHIHDTSVWAMLEAVRTREPSTIEQVRKGLLSVVEEDEKADVSAGLDHLMDFYRRVERTNLVYSVTLGSSRLNPDRNKMALAMLGKMGTDSFLKQLHTELVEGAL